MKCLECPVGTFCAKENCEFCDLCDAGYEANGIGQGNCTMCIPGFSKPFKSKDVCKECDTGWFSIKPGSVKCVECPKGYFCPCSSCEPRICPLNSVCPSGTAHYIECEGPFYYVKNANDDSCTATLQFYIVVFGSVSSIIVLITVAILTIKKKKGSKFVDKLEYKKQLLKDEHDILYHGY